MVECPIEGCGYTGGVESVEAHISGSRGDGHQGEVGRHHREALVAAAGGDGEGSTEEAEPAVEAGSTEGSTSGAAAAAGVPLLAAGSGMFGSSDSEGMSPVLIGGLVLAVLLVLLLVASPSGESGSEPAVDQGGDTQESATSQDGGLA